MNSATTAATTTPASSDHPPDARVRRVGGFGRLLGRALFAAAFLGCAASASAVTLSKDAPATVLHGESSTVRVTVSGQTGDPELYNLTVRDVLPAGVSYVAGSASPEPSQIPLADGTTVLVWSNLSDLSPGSNYTLAYKVAHSGALDVGSTYTNTAQALLNTDPRIVPRVNATTGAAVAGSYTSTATGSDSTKVTALTITKDEPSPEGEILRGLHDHPTTVNMTVRANSVNPVTGVVIDDYLPANLEFLGCGGIDNTAPGVVEYPGAPRLTSVPTITGCTMPGLVETVTIDPDGPDGPLPAGVYTHLRWTSAQIPALGTMTPSSAVTINYRVGVPLHENTTEWAGATPATNGPQSANLDNNSGPVTVDEQPILSPATASGTYHPTAGGTTPASDSTTLERTAEDVRMRKSVTPGIVQNAQIAKYTFTVDVSEYQDASNLVITDTMPNGMCPLGPANPETTPPAANAECDPVPGQLPTLAYSQVTENANGTFTIRWNVASLARNGTLTVTYPARVRIFYQQAFADNTSRPVLASDAMDNTVRLTGDATGTPTGSPGVTVPVVDESAAQVVVAAPTIDKTVSNQASPTLNCATATYVDGIAAGAYRPGDRVCFRLRADFPPNAFTSDVRITDFLPAGLVVENVAPLAGSSPGWIWNVDEPVIQWTHAAAVPDGSQVFLFQVSAIAADPIQVVPDQIAGNLMKLRYANSDATTFPLRDGVDFVQTAPRIALDKDVVSINGTPGTVAQGGDQVVYRVRPTNTGGVAVHETEVWDNLPPGIMCADVTALPAPAAPATVSCSNVGDHGRIVWKGLSIAAGSTASPAAVSLQYTVTMPGTYAPRQILTNTAGVRQFQATTNRGTEYTYIPQNNIDPAQPTAVTGTDRFDRGITGRADDTASITIRDVAVAKERAGTSLTETGNTAAQSVPGERISYKVTVTLPDGVTLTNAQINDVLGAGQRLEAGTLSTTLDGAPLPAGWTVSTSPFRITLPSPYVIPDGANRVVVMTFDATVLSGAPSTVTNRANMTWSVPALGTQTQQSDLISTPVLRPALAVTKSTDLGTAGPTPDGYVSYALAVSNTGTSRAHDVLVTDLLPPGTVPVDGANAVVPATIGVTVPCPTTPNPTNGAAAGPCPSVPDATQTAVTPRRELRWTIPVIEVGGSVTVRYRVKLPSAETANATLTNDVTVGGDSYPGTNPDQETVTASTSHTLTWAESTIAKAADRTSQVVGGTVTYTVDVVIPPGVRHYDSVVTDRLPDGMSLVSYDSATCVTGCSPADPLNAIATIPASTEADGSVLAGWWLNDIDASTSARTVRLVYTARIDTTYSGTGTPPAGTPVDGGDTLTNAAQLQWQTSSGTDTPPATPPPPTTDGPTTTPQVNAPVTVVRPRIIMNKHVSCDGADPGPTGGDTDACSTEVTTTPFTYTISVHNTGTSTAYDVLVDDVTPSTLRDFVMGTTPPGVTVVDGTAPNLRWRIGSIPVNGTVTITYTARWQDSSQLPTPSTAVNTAGIPSYYGAVQADRDGAPPGSYPTYTDGGSDVVTLTALFPDATVDKTTGTGAESGTAEVGQPFAWRVTVLNDSSTGARNVTVRDTLPAGWEYVAGSSAISVNTTPATSLATTPAVSGQDLTWATGYTLPAGRTMTVTFQARPTSAVLADPAPRTYTNTARATVEDGMGNTGNLTGPYDDGPDTAEATVVLPLPGIAKIPDGSSVSAGDTDVPFEILAQNFTGTVPLRNAVVTDVLPAGVTFDASSVALQSCTPGPSCTAVALPPGLVSQTGQTVTFDLGTIASGTGYRISYTVDVASPLANGTVLTNTARLTGDEIPSGTVIQDPGSLVVGSSPNWFGPGDTTLKTSTPVTGSQVAPASDITYRIDYNNSGNENATQVVLTDEIPAHTTYVGGSASANATAVPSFRVGGVYQATEPADPAGVQAVRWTIPTVVAGTGGFQTFRVRVDQPLPDGTVIENRASIASQQTPVPDSFGPDPFDRTVPVTHHVHSAPVLSLRKDVDQTTITLSRSAHRLAYTLTLANTGDANATDAVVEDSVPVGTTLASIADGGGTVTCSTDPGDPGFTFGPCPADLSAVTRIRWSFATVVTRDTSPAATPRPPVVMGFAVDIPIPTVDGTTIPNRADVVSDETPPGTSNPVTTLVRSAPDIAIGKSLSVTQASPGSEIAYAVTVTNSGTAIATNASIADAVPAGTRYVAGSVSDVADFRVGGTWQTTEPADPATVEAVRWTVGTLGIDQSVTRGFRVVVPADAPRTLTEVLNAATFGSDQATATSNRVRTEVLHPPLPPTRANVTIVKRGPARLRAGRDGVWRITVRNNSRATARNVIVRDAFPRGLVVRKISTGGRLVSGRVQWKFATLRPGQSRTVWVRFRAPLTAHGRVVNVASVTATNARTRSARRAVVLLRAAGVGRVPVVG